MASIMSTVATETNESEDIDIMPLSFQNMHIFYNRFKFTPPTPIIIDDPKPI